MKLNFKLAFVAFLSPSAILYPDDYQFIKFTQALGAQRMQRSTAENQYEQYA